MTFWGLFADMGHFKANMGHFKSQYGTFLDIFGYVIMGHLVTLGRLWDILETFRLVPLLSPYWCDYDRHL